MTTQTEMFPKTELDEATAVLSHLMSEKEKASTAADNAEQKNLDATVRVEKQQHVIAMLQTMMPAAEPITEATAEEDDIEDAEILQIEGDVLDPITGEVTSKADAVSCDTCGNMDSCNSRQRKGSGKTGCGGDSWEPRKPEVLVAWPDNLDMQTIDVGPLTRYGELAAKFLNSLPGDDPRRVDSFLDYRIVDVDAGTERDPHATITPADYGLEFSVESIAKAEESAA